MLNKRQYSHKMQDSEMLGERKKKKKKETNIGMNLKYCTFICISKFI